MLARHYTIHHPTVRAMHQSKPPAPSSMPDRAIYAQYSPPTAQKVDWRYLQVLERCSGWSGWMVFGSATCDLSRGSLPIIITHLVVWSDAQEVLFDLEGERGLVQVMYSMRCCTGWVCERCHLHPEQLAGK
jgi:hypothetical protein